MAHCLKVDIKALKEEGEVDQFVVGARVTIASC